MLFLQLVIAHDGTSSIQYLGMADLFHKKFLLLQGLKTLCSSMFLTVSNTYCMQKFLWCIEVFGLGAGVLLHDYQTLNHAVTSTLKFQIIDCIWGARK
jgi:hypothetical protein